MSLIKKIEEVKKQISKGENNMSDMNELRARLKAAMDKKNEKEEEAPVAAKTEPVAKTEAETPKFKIDMSKFKKQLLSKALEGTKIPEPEWQEIKDPEEEKTIEQDIPVINADIEENNTDLIMTQEDTATVSNENKETVEPETNPVKEPTPDTAEENKPEEVKVEEVTEENNAAAMNDIAQLSSEHSNKEDEKPAKKTRKRRTKKAIKDEENATDTIDEVDNTVDDVQDYDMMTQVVDEHFTTKDFSDMINDFSERIKSIRIESDMNLGVFKVAQAELVNLRDEVAVEYAKTSYSFEAANAMVKQITDKNIGNGSSADARKANVAKALSNAIIDGVPVDVSFCFNVSKLRKQAIQELLERIDAKLKACITMSAILKMEQVSC